MKIKEQTGEQMNTAGKSVTKNRYKCATTSTTRPPLTHNVERSDWIILETERYQRMSGMQIHGVITFAALEKAKARNRCDWYSEMIEFSHAEPSLDRMIPKRSLNLIEAFLLQVMSKP